MPYTETTISLSLNENKDLFSVPDHADNISNNLTNTSSENFIKRNLSNDLLLKLSKNNEKIYNYLKNNYGNKNYYRIVSYIKIFNEMIPNNEYKTPTLYNLLAFSQLDNRPELFQYISSNDLPYINLKKLLFFAIECTKHNNQSKIKINIKYFYFLMNSSQEFLELYKSDEFESKVNRFFNENHEFLKIYKNIKLKINQISFENIINNTHNKIHICFINYLLFLSRCEDNRILNKFDATYLYAIVSLLNNHNFNIKNNLYLNSKFNGIVFLQYLRNNIHTINELYNNFKLRNNNFFEFLIYAYNHDNLFLDKPLSQVESIFNKFIENNNINKNPSSNPHNLPIKHSYTMPNTIISHRLLINKNRECSCIIS